MAPALNSSENAVQLAVVGAGLVGRRHIDVIRRTKTVELSAIVDNSSAAEAFADSIDTPFFKSLANLFEQGSADGIVLATPNRLHLEQGLECIAAGKPLLIEKPIAITTEEANQLVAASAEAAVAVLVGHHRRYNPLIHQARAIIDEGRLGRLRTAHASCWFYKPDDYFDQAPWRKAAGAGPVFVNLIHDVDLLRYLCGEVVSVQAQMVSSTRGFENEDVAGVLLRFDNDVIATLSVSDTAVAPWSWEMTSGENPAFPVTDQSCYWLSGTQGALSIPDLTLWRQDDPHWMKPLLKSTGDAAVRDPFACQIEHFAAVIRGEEEPLVSAVEGTASLRVIEAIHESAQSGATVYLG